MVVMDKPKDSGQARLEALGYKQSLNRDLGVLGNFAFSFNIIAVLASVSILYGYGLNYGGPISMVYGWMIGGFFNLFLAVSMAEICSAYPTTGGLYYWSYMLSGRKWGPLGAWLTGWSNLTAQWAFTATVDYSLAILLQAIILLSTGGGNGGGYYISKYHVIAIDAGFLITHGLVNSLPIGVLGFLGTLASVWNMVGILVLMVLIPLVSTHPRSAEWVFTSFNTDDGVGIHSYPYIFLVGLLICPLAIFGYDTSAHMTEETKASDKNGAYGLLSGVILGTVFGFAYMLGILFATGDPLHVLDPGNDAHGYAIAQVFYDAFYSRYGSGVGGIICLGVVAVSLWFCGMSTVTTNSRMVYAFSRDGAMPLSKVWHSVNRREVPIHAVWLSAFMGLVIGLPSLGSSVAFQAMVSIAGVAFYVSYALPVLLRITFSRNTFIPGPFYLGKTLSLFVGWVAVLWVVALAVMVCLPVAYPIESQTLNYAPVAFGGMLVLVLGAWVLFAHKWFQGPVREIEKLYSNPLPL
ncbi:unnamed protein product [Calypogeia fissa]